MLRYFSKVPAWEVAYVVEIIDYILSTNSKNVTVGEIKKKFNLSSDEYDKIYEIAMAFIRGQNTMLASAYERQYIRLRSRLLSSFRLAACKDDPTASKVRLILESDRAEFKDIKRQIEQGIYIPEEKLEKEDGDDDVSEIEVDEAS